MKGHLGKEAAHKKTGAVIVAAGAVRRPDDPRPMMKMGSITVIQRLIATLQQAEVDPIVVVTGAHAENLERHIGKQGVICLHGSDQEGSEMFDSVRIGSAYIRDCCEQVLFSPADTPLFTVATVKRLMASGMRLAVPVCDGKNGHPILVSCELLEQIGEYRGAGGLRQALENCGEPIGQIQVEDKGVLYETDMEEDHTDLLQQHNRQLLRPKVKIALAKERMFFDQTTAMLLRLIQRTRSVRAACLLMDLSYSKGWELLNLMEEQLGYPVLIRHPGGMNGGHTMLSPEGDQLLKDFERFEIETRKAVNEIYGQIFGSGKLYTS